MVSNIMLTTNYMVRAMDVNSGQAICPQVCSQLVVSGIFFLVLKKLKEPVFFSLAPARGLTPARRLVGWLVGWLAGWLVGWLAVWLVSWVGLLGLVWWQFRVDRGWFGVSVGLAEILMRAGLGFVWGSFSLAKGPICRMRLGGFQVDFGSVLA